MILNTKANPSTRWNVLGPLFGLSSLLLAGGAYVFHWIMRQSTAPKVPTMSQPGSEAEDLEEYQQLKLYHQPQPCMVHQPLTGYSTPSTRTQGGGDSLINRSVKTICSDFDEYF